MVVELGKMTISSPDCRGSLIGQVGKVMVQMLRSLAKRYSSAIAYRASMIDALPSFTLDLTSNSLTAWSCRFHEQCITDTDTLGRHRGYAEVGQEETGFANLCL